MDLIFRVHKVKLSLGGPGLNSMLPESINSSKQKDERRRLTDERCEGAAKIEAIPKKV
jgi:hypothetical protein